MRASTYTSSLFSPPLCCSVRWVIDILSSLVDAKTGQKQTDVVNMNRQGARATRIFLLLLLLRFLFLLLSFLQISLSLSLVTASVSRLSLFSPSGVRYQQVESWQWEKKQHITIRLFHGIKDQIEHTNIRQHGFWYIEIKKTCNTVNWRWNTIIT